MFENLLNRIVSVTESTISQPLEDMVDTPVPLNEMDLTSEEMTADQKARFGKPINEPNLAENIKGKNFPFPKWLSQSCE